ncbi:YrdB family protein [Bacillus pseudomycoides]|uniref:YrdB family protein n=1 Tax=Bacillus pseudomycoides TaxID=64104 RepID=UPI0028D378E4|nr:YrdB family protein [Bacillus pseudomycoides]
MILAIVLPLIVAVIWRLFGAPSATWKVQGVLHLMLEVVIFGLGIAALYHLRYVTLVTVFMIVIIMNSVLMYVWRQ